MRRVLSLVALSLAICSVTARASFFQIHTKTNATAQGTVAREYTYDLAGNRLTQRHTHPGGTELTAYMCDDLNRLLEAHGPGLEAEYRYDLNGNRVRKIMPGATVTYRYDGQNRLRVAHDTRGVLLLSLYDYRTRRIFKYEQTAAGHYDATLFEYEGGWIGAVDSVSF